MKKRAEPIAAKPDDSEEPPGIEDILDPSAWEDRLVKARQMRAEALARRPDHDSGGMVTRARIGAVPTAVDSPKIAGSAANSDDIESVEDILNTPNLNERFEKARIRHSQIQALKQAPHGPAARPKSGVDPAAPKKSVLFAFGGARGPDEGRETTAPVAPAAAAPNAEPGVDATTPPTPSAPPVLWPTPEKKPTPAPALRPAAPRRRITPVRIAAALVFFLLVAVAVPGPVRSLTGGLIADLRASLLAPAPKAPLQQAALPTPIQPAPTQTNPTQTNPTRPAPVPTAPQTQPATTSIQPSSTATQPAPTAPTPAQTAPAQTVLPAPTQSPSVPAAPQPAPATPAAPLVQTQSRYSLAPPAADTVVDAVVQAAPAPATPGVDVAVARNGPSLPDAPGLGAPPLVQTTTPAYQVARKQAIQKAAPARIGGTEVAASILSQDMAPGVAVLRSGSVAPFVLALKSRSISLRPAATLAVQPGPNAKPTGLLAGPLPPRLSVGLLGGVQGGRPAPLGRSLAGLPTLPGAAVPGDIVVRVPPLSALAGPAALPFVQKPPSGNTASSSGSAKDAGRGQNQPLSALIAVRAAPPPAPATAGTNMALPARYAARRLPGRPDDLALGAGAAIAPAQSASPALRPATPGPIKAATAPAAPATVPQQAGVAPPTPEQAGVVLASFAPLPGARPGTAPALHTRPPSSFIEPLIAPEHELAGVGVAGQDAAVLARFNVHVNAPRGVSQARLDAVVAALAKTGYPIGAPNRVGFLIRQSNVRYFYRADLGAAVELAAVVGATARDFTGYSPKPPPGTIEIWMAGGSTTPSRTAPASPPTASGPQADQDPALMALRNRLINSLRRGDILQQPSQ